MTESPHSFTFPEGWPEGREKPWRFHTDERLADILREIDQQRRGSLLASQKNAIGELAGVMGAMAQFRRDLASAPDDAARLELLGAFLKATAEPAGRP